MRSFPLRRATAACLTLVALAVGLAGPPKAAAQTPAKLLFQSVCVLGTAQEFLTIYNPGSTAVDLTNYYLTDGVFTGEVYAYIVDPATRTPEKAGGGTFNDFHVRFPAGASIAAHDTIAVAIQGNSAFQATYGRRAAFEIVMAAGEGDAVVPTMLEAFAGSIATGWGLSNGSECVALYYWDQQSDKVVDVDYFAWGTSGTAKVDKTGLSLDGPDADTTPTPYLAETAIASQKPALTVDATNGHTFGNAFRREDFNEGTQRTTAGNGVGGRDETSENMDVTWSNSNAASVPFFKGGAPPVAVLTARPGGPYSGTVGNAITFSGSASTPATGGTITAYSWNFGDASAMGSGVSPTHAYAAAGSYTVTLTVTGSVGGTASASTTATITTDTPPPAGNAAKLLFQSVCVLGTAQEYVSIYNPNSTTVDLTNYYLTDGVFTGEVYAYIVDPATRTPEKAGGGTFNDFHVRFPAGAAIAAHDTIAVAIQGEAAFESSYSRKADYEIVMAAGEGDAAVPTMLEAFTGSIATGWGLSNGSECVALYYWDQQSDKVVDVDYFAWGTSGTAKVDKTGLSLDGPDADTTPTPYLAETAIASQKPALTVDATNGHTFGNAFRREDFNEGTQRTTAGNGVGGRDETSENMDVTWSNSNPASPPFPGGVVPPPPGQLTAVPGGPYRASLGASITFNGSGSTPKTGETITAYVWNFGDNTAAGNGVSVSHTYAAAGTYTVTLTVTGSGGGTASAGSTATVSAPLEGALQVEARTFMPTLSEKFPIKVDVAAGSVIMLRIFDLEGREVKVLFDGEATKKDLTWDGRDAELMLVPAGTYLCHLEVRDSAGHVQNHVAPVVVARRLERN